ncbi:MAG: M50 family metallopeptidase [Chloroflexota bacterium]
MNETALTWIIFILAFGGMVVVHELGHFLASRLVKVEVEEFGIGFPTPGAVTFWISPGYFFLRSGKRVDIPRNFRMPVWWSDLVNHEVTLSVREENGRFILQAIEAVLAEEKTPDSKTEAPAKRLVKAGKAEGGAEWTDVISEVHPGTRFTLNWLPIGGFVRPKGENDPEVPGGLAAASPWKRLFVLSAGPFMNLLTAVLVISLIIHQVGGIIVSPPPDSTAPQQMLITEVIAGSPAELGGIRVGDILLTANGEPLTTAERLSEIIQANPGMPIHFEVRRGSETLELTVTPRMDEQAGRPKIGIGYCPGCEFKPITSLTETLGLSLQVTGAQIYALVTLPIRLVRGSIAPEQGRLIGLKGIFDIMSQSVSNDVEAAQTQPPASSSAPNPNAPVQTLSIIALLSISLGIFNLFPFPALDGGRILFVLPELIFRRRVPHKLENLVHGIGMALLLILMIYVNVRDFIDPVIP